MLPNAAGNWIEERKHQKCNNKCPHSMCVSSSPKISPKITKHMNAVAVMMLLMIVQNRDNSTHNVQL